jgi:hypothetical protein
MRRGRLASLWQAAARSGGRTAVVGVTAALATLASIPSARPAFPGANGEIAYSIVLPNDPLGILGDSRFLDIDVCTIRPGDRTRRRITGPGSMSAWTSDAAWSPDGTRLALRLTGPFQSALKLVAADGSNEVDLRPPGHSPAWAPDGDRLVYVSTDVPTGPGRIAVITVSGEPVRIVAERGDDPAWSPDGSRIAYVDGGQIFTVAADGTGRLQLTNGARAHAAPNWSPDGRTIVFAAQTGPGSDPTVEVVAAGGGAPRRLAAVRRTDAFASPAFVDPTWSPDGGQIAFVSRQPDSPATDVYTMNADGTGVTNVTQSPFYEYSVDWRSLPPSGFLARSAASCGVGGTARGDRLVGTAAEDVVYALGGDDRVSSLGGNDILLAGPGRDVANLGAGADLAYGEEGNDVLNGEAGNDDLSGEEGNDRLVGGDGDDALGGEIGADGESQRGGPGDDVIEGGRGNDLLFGGSGRDRLVGGPGRDSVLAGDGNDTILVRDGSVDVVRCGRGTRDVVLADRQDRVDRRECERILRR